MKIQKIETIPDVTIATWQSIFRLEPEWFSRYQSVIIDECHLAKAESLRGIMEKMPHCAFRIGVTGTLDDAKSNSLMVEGVCGPAFRVASTSDLQTLGHLTPILIQAHFLQYNEQDKHTLREVYRSYIEEMDFIVGHQGRMEWLVRFLGKLPGNVLVLCQYVEKHCVPLYDSLRTTYPQRPIHYVTGEVNGEDREDIRALIDAEFHVVLEFNSIVIRCHPNQEVVLVSGETKLASQLTVDDDIAPKWITEQSKSSY